MRRGLFIYVILWVLIPVVVVTALGEIFGGWVSYGHRQETRQFQETLRLVSDHFVYAHNVDTGEITGDAIDHLLRSLDENSEYLPLDDAKDFEIETEQRYGGIGVEVEWADDRVTIVSPFADSPGELAGFLPGDQIIRVEGLSMDGKNTGKLLICCADQPGVESSLLCFVRLQNLNWKCRSFARLYRWIVFGALACLNLALGISG
jgi:hypothetical protein